MLIQLLKKICLQNNLFVKKQYKTKPFEISKCIQTFLFASILAFTFSAKEFKNCDMNSNGKKKALFIFWGNQFSHEKYHVGPFVCNKKNKWMIGLKRI